MERVTQNASCLTHLAYGSAQPTLFCHFSCQAGMQLPLHIHHGISDVEALPLGFLLYTLRSTHIHTDWLRLTAREGYLPPGAFPYSPSAEHYLTAKGIQDSRCFGIYAVLLPHHQPVLPSHMSCTSHHLPFLPHFHSPHCHANRHRLGALPLNAATPGRTGATTDALPLFFFTAGTWRSTSRCSTRYVSCGLRLIHTCGTHTAGPSFGALKARTRCTQRLPSLRAAHTRAGRVTAAGLRTVLF